MTVVTSGRKQQEHTIEQPARTGSSDQPAPGSPPTQTAAELVAASSMEPGECHDGGQLNDRLEETDGALDFDSNEELESDGSNNQPPVHAGRESISDSELDEDEEVDEEEEEEEEEDDEDNEDDEDIDDEQPPADEDRDSNRSLGSRKWRKSRRGSAQGSQQARCTSCQPMAYRIMADGLPVSDVDQVSYRDLCKMEQLRAEGGYQAGGRGVSSLRPETAAGGGYSCQRRRSSLQEESGAYYELCLSPEEQLIRQKYLWYPPSLRKLELVDKFFAPFPRERIPLAEQSQAADQIDDRKDTEAGGAHRERQISFQLPRQDVSLDYCSYPMDETNRKAYSQMVDRRNRQALDVGIVVQIGAPRSGRRGASKMLRREAHPVQRSDSQQSRVSRQRKASIMSQSGALMVPCEGEHSEPSAGPGAQSQTQRCRRCLVRFKEGELAVAAPNFIIGSTLYPMSRAAAAAAAAAAATSATPLSNLRRRASTVQAASAEDSDAEPRGRRSGLESAAEPPAHAALFHGTCFTCSTCKEFLVDLVYCLRDNKLYCLRHYGESLRPRCSCCKELIFSDEYLKAMNESFHIDHFLCRQCDLNLAGQRYVLKDEKPFCVQCFESNFANQCEDCHRAIGIDSRDLSYKDRHWHDSCFVCHKCQQSLIDKPFGSKLEKVYCADCYDTTFAARCDGCKNPFRAGSKKMEYRGRQWHDSCFCCCVCQNTIGSSSFIPKNEEIYCIKCYEDKYATRCTKCKLVIVSGGVTFRNEPWHRDCFTCCHCKKSLAGQRFTTRDPPKSDSSTNEQSSESGSGKHNAYCIECYGELFAKKCYACSQAITGLGGTRFVSFEDRSWHNDCFLCNDCQQSLVGKGFITDGPESILCGDCARAKLR